MLMQFGQFLDHDITLTPINKVGPFSILFGSKPVVTEQVHFRGFRIPSWIAERATRLKPCTRNAGQFRCQKMTLIFRP